MVDAVYRGNVEELLSVINHLKKYIIVFVIVLFILISIFHYSKYSVQVVPLITVTLVLLPAVYYTTVLFLHLTTSIMASGHTGEETTINAVSNRQALKTPDLSYPKCPTPPPSYEEATRNDNNNCHYQPQPWLPSTSSGYTSGAVPPVFSVEYHYNAAVSNAVHGRPATEAATTVQNRTGDGCPPPTPPKTAVIQNIPSVTITMDSADQRPMEI